MLSCISPWVLSFSSNISKCLATTYCHIPLQRPYFVTCLCRIDAWWAIVSDCRDRPDSGGVRGAEISPPSPRAAKSRPPSHETYSRRHPGVKNAPSISIEPDTNLELTEEMVHGQNKVMTRDTPLAKAYGSDRHEAEVSITPIDWTFLSLSIDHDTYVMPTSVQKSIACHKYGVFIVP